MCISCSLSPCLELLNRKLWFIKDDKKRIHTFFVALPPFLILCSISILFSCWQGVWEKIRSKVSILAQFLKVTYMLSVWQKMSLFAKNLQKIIHIHKWKKIDTVLNLSLKLSFHAYILRYIPWLFIKFVEMPKPQSSGFLKY